MRLRFRRGFNPTLLMWGAPDQPAEWELCSYCDAPILEDAVPLRMWREDGWAIVLCDACVERWIEPSAT